MLDRPAGRSRAEVEILLEGVPWKSALQTIASRLGLGVSRLGNVVYLGPPQAAKRLGSRGGHGCRQVRRLPRPCNGSILLPSRWPGTTLPRRANCWLNLASENGLQDCRLEAMPHDLWAAADLPPLTLVERLTLIAIQFDLVFKIAAGGRRMELRCRKE